MKTRTEQYQERLDKMGYPTALSYALSIVIFNTNSFDEPNKMSDERLLKEIEYATEYIKGSLNKELNRVRENYKCHTHL